MAKAATKTCQSCKANFVIDPEDFAFYEKMKVPAPTWCPDCRAMRRFTWRNEWHLFKKVAANTGKEIFSAFSPASPMKVITPEDWYSDSWDPLEYGRDYEFSRSFFDQFRELSHTVPVIARPILQTENSEYSMNVAFVKNCYLVTGAMGTQDSAYLLGDAKSRNCIDDHMTINCELCYGSVNLANCYQTHYSLNCDGCRDIWFSRDCVGSSNLFGCVNLHNKQYHIFNKPYSREDYEAKLREFNLGSYDSLRKNAQRAYDFWLQFPNRSMLGDKNQDVSGDYIYGCKNATHCWRIRDVEDAKYSQMASNQASDHYDTTGCAAETQQLYEAVYCGDRIYNTKFSWCCASNCQDVTYSIFCLGSSNLFGCVSLRGKEYCILNKQYTKEEYEALVPKIIQHMNDMPYVDSQGREYRYGEFFPAELSPYEYNITFAQEEFPLTEQEAARQGYTWYDQPKPATPVQIQTGDVPDDTANSTPDLIGQVIACMHNRDCSEECTGVFTIIAQEYAFLVEQGVPLPRLCPNCRQYARINQRRGMKLYTRHCHCAGETSSNGAYTNLATKHASHLLGEQCPNEFDTSFASDRPEIVYCEPCYQAEIV